jgi:hypothetical protein
MIMDEFTGLWYPASTIKTSDATKKCMCTKKHNSIEVSSNKCNSCKKKLNE